jgi:hypothetical protein
MTTPTAPRNPKRRKTEEQTPQLPRIAEIQEQDAQTSRSRSKSPSRATDITDVGDLEKYDPPIYFKSTREFEAAVESGDKAISEELQTLIQTTQIKRTATHSGVIPLALKVEFACTHDHAILQLTWLFRSTLGLKGLSKTIFQEIPSMRIGSMISPCRRMTTFWG